MKTILILLLIGIITTFISCDLSNGKKKNPVVVTKHSPSKSEKIVGYEWFLGMGF